MNQEQNNFNPNNFNAQGNNGIPNNQPLQNNQGFNPTFNQNVGQNPNVSVTTFNPQPPVESVQPHPTPSYERPIIQEPTPQSMNTFESCNTNNQNFNSKPQKKMNLGLIIGIVVAIVIIGTIGIIISINLLKSNISKKLNNNLNESTDNLNSENDAQNQTEYEAEWSDFTVYIHGIEFSFPMSFQEFEKKIASTKYESYYKSDREKLIYPSIMDMNSISYKYTTNEFTSNNSERTYTIYIDLQNLEEEAQPAYNTMVVGIETPSMHSQTIIDEGSFDKNIYFTKKKLYLGQKMTKAKLEKTFGRGNSWIDGSNEYGAGNFVSAFYKFPKFHCIMNNDNIIKKIEMKNYIIKE